jgi:predicted component of type VI protein secretion system
MQVTLVMFKADGTRRDFQLRKSRMVIGRAATADLRIPLSSVSRQHCEVFLEDGLVKMRDLGSSNGTYHNSVRSQDAVLAPGDELVVGPVVFTMVIDGLPKVVEPVRTILPQEAEGGNDFAPSQNNAIHAADISPSEANDREVAELIEAEMENDAPPAKHAAKPAPAIVAPPAKPAAAKPVVDDDSVLALEDDDLLGLPPAPAGQPGEDDDPIAALAALADEDESSDLPLLAEDDDDVKKPASPASSSAGGKKK